MAIGVPQTVLFPWIQHHRRRLALLVIVVVTLLLSAKGITNPQVMAVHGDVPRHTMNGVFVHDLIRDWPITDPLQYAYRYFARYPALSIGHHSVLLGLAAAPLHAIFGVSIFAARLTIVAFMLCAALSWFYLILSTHDEPLAFLSTLLLVTTPFIVEHARVVLSEIPALATGILSTYLFVQFCKTSHRRYLLLLCLTFPLTLLARYQMIFLLLIYGLYCFATGRLRFTPSTCRWLGLSALMLLLLAWLSLTFATSNLAWIMGMPLAKRFGFANLTYYLTVLWTNHLHPAVLILSLVGLLIALYRKEQRALLFLLWIGVHYLFMTATGAQQPRYGLYWIPPFCLFAASIGDGLLHCSTVLVRRRRPLLFSVYSLLLVITGYQFALSAQKPMEYIEGYEGAARYVVEQPYGASVLFCARIDTGYFVFYVRKHSPEDGPVILQADKLLVTTKLQWIVERRIKNKAELYDLLHRFGVGYVVIEEVAGLPWEAGPLQWLNEEVESERFDLQKDIVVHSNSPPLRHARLKIYAYKASTPPLPNQTLQLHIPLIHRSITVPFDDLLPQ